MEVFSVEDIPETEDIFILVMVCNIVKQALKYTSSLSI